MPGSGGKGDPAFRLKFPVVPDEATQEKLELVVAQLERERDEFTAHIDTSANSCFGLLTQWQIDYVKKCHTKWSFLKKGGGAQRNRQRRKRNSLKKLRKKPTMKQ